MKELSDAEIKELTGRKGVKRIAVENFLGSLNEAAGRNGNAKNLRADALLYGWNDATVLAIQEGIRLAFS